EMIATHEGMDRPYSENADHHTLREGADELIAAVTLPLDASNEFRLVQVGTQLDDQREGHGPFPGLKAADLQVAAHSPFLQLHFNSSRCGTIAAWNRAKSDIKTVRAVDRHDRERQINQFLLVEMGADLVI